MLDDCDFLGVDKGHSDVSAPSHHPNKTGVPASQCQDIHVSRGQVTYAINSERSRAWGIHGTTCRRVMREMRESVWVDLSQVFQVSQAKCIA